MSYMLALETAGATVHTFEEFGSYQGDWWAKVTFNNVTGWVHGYYGSCDMCDAFVSEFGYGSSHRVDYDYHSINNLQEDCGMCDDLKERLAQFGMGYLEGMLTQEEAVAEVSRNIAWDTGAEGMVRFICRNK